jgi:ribonuclease R
MLPESLSNGACSLNAGEEKYTLSAIIDLSSDGEIEGVKIEPSVIVSCVRGVYSEINALLSGTADASVRKKYSRVLPTLNKMVELYKLLEARSRLRGAVDFEADEAKIIMNSDGDPIDIVKRERGLSERMIEQFMICANVAVATELDKRGIPCVYRVHAEPPAEKMANFLTFVHNLGLNTSFLPNERISAKELSRILCDAEEQGVLAPVSYAMLRSMAKAEYSRVRAMHFGLGLSHYCHFTSPIRRLSDLATHRIIHRIMLEGKRPEAYNSYAGRAAAAATEAELRAVDAERRIENLYKVIYMSRYIGEEFDAAVSSVASFGIFCTLENTCEGLVPISDLPGMFFYDEGNVAMRSSSIVIRLGDAVRVRLEDADITEGRLRFSLVDIVNREE